MKRLRYEAKQAQHHNQAAEWGRIISGLDYEAAAAKELGEAEATFTMAATIVVFAIS